jgi:hypothetical protein
VTPSPARMARQLHLSAAILAASVLTDSSLEHYRGSFRNPAMYAPLAAAAALLGANFLGVLDGRGRPHPARRRIAACAATVGIAGLGFHTYNIAKRPGGSSWLNLFYAAPIGAPAALVLAALLGRSAERIRGSSIPSRTQGRRLAALSTAGLAGAAAEAGLLHFRGSFQNRAMVLPVSVPPIAATLLGAAACTPRRSLKRLARASLTLTALLGFAGVGFHARGISRNMGGWRNWSQNILNGPPLPAPPSFSGVALAGLVALRLMG